MTVGNAKKICVEAEGNCNKCSIRELCNLTTDGSFSLKEYYDMMTYEDSDEVSIIIKYETRELQSRLEGLEQLLKKEEECSSQIPERKTGLDLDEIALRT